MIYNFKEYEPIFDTPMKRQQELAISRKIMNLLNKNKYDNLEEFIIKNNNYQDFLKKNNMQTVIKHFGNTLIEADYIKILENLRVLTKKKQDFDKQNVKSTNLGDKQITTFEGEHKTYFIDNSNSNKNIEEQMKDLQPTQQEFQTSDMNQNTENMFKELEKMKETLNPRHLNEINYHLLNSQEKELYSIALNYQKDIGSNVRIDLKRGIILNELNEIMKIEKNNGEFIIFKDDDETIMEETHQAGIQKKLIPSKNTIYSN